MNNLRLILCAATVTLVANAEARILRVNRTMPYANCANASTCFSDLALAVASSLSGDTIHIEASILPYTDPGQVLQIDQHPLVLIGPGYKLWIGTNDNLELQANTRTAVVQRMLITGLASGTVICGLDFSNPGGGGGAGLQIAGVSNITIRRNYFAGACPISFSGLNGDVCDSILVAGNYIDSDIRQIGAYDNVITNLVIRNNYFSGLPFDLNDLGDDITGLMILNNTFGYAGSNEVAVRDAIVEYNVFRNLDVPGAANNVVSYNLYDTGISFPSGMGNLPVSSWPVPTTATDDGRWDFPAHPTYAPVGADAYGMYGGADAYHLSGIPPIPTIYQLSSTVTTTPGGNVQVTLSTRSNN